MMTMLPEWRKWTSKLLRTKLKKNNPSADFCFILLLIIQKKNYSNGPSEKGQPPYKGHSYFFCSIFSNHVSVLKIDSCLVSIKKFVSVRASIDELAMASKSLDTASTNVQVKPKMTEVKVEDSSKKHQDIVLLNVGGKR